jgi:hypothetical protein
MLDLHLGAGYGADDFMWNALQVETLYRRERTAAALTLYKKLDSVISLCIHIRLARTGAQSELNTGVACVYIRERIVPSTGWIMYCGAPSSKQTNTQTRCSRIPDAIVREASSSK